MEQKKINEFSILAIIKLYIYQHGIFVPDELFEKLHENKYDGYRTTSGIFMKLGGTLSKAEFEYFRNNGMINHLIGDISNLTYEKYLEQREWATAGIITESSINSQIESDTYFKLQYDKDGRFKIIGQYKDKTGMIFPIELDDVGIFLQGKYNDEEAVAIQAGGIRARVSIAGKNCSSGCSFCSFSNEASQYKKNTYTDEKLYNYLAPLIEQVVREKGIKNLFITGGNPSLDDMENWTKYLEKCISIFKNALITQGIDPNHAKIDAMITPRTFTKYTGTKEEYFSYLKHLKDLGITAISPNMEIWSQENLEKYCPSNEYTRGTSKADIGHKGYIDFISQAVTVFGKFNVRSAIIVGLEPIDKTKEAITELINMGCYVTLSPFMPPECARYGTELPQKSPSTEVMLELNNFLEATFLKYLSKLSIQERREAIINMNNSLNSHNRHNTGNINGSLTPLDYKERDALLNGYDDELATSTKMLDKIKQNKNI